MAKLIVVSSQLSDKNELQTLLLRQHYLFTSWLSYFSGPVSVDQWFKPLSSNVTSVIPSNPTRSYGLPQRSHSFHWV